ncbi:type I restriction enzyme S subunit [Elizabethkingia sp. YR214]|uniref:restriction endonuclease subunit S n=1 Tax=Elizabethkingia sp. YR214 TaxID=2135667 RepID=UPI000D2F94EE|nr:restriction endonuclease subunit S [Elizabethkingia sp. YR214]PUB29448.1 type I restriction enzyme S subunit [Elizabethkingia sp. YR214]
MNKTENKLVPELRFPEFINDGEWKKTELDKLAHSISSGKDKNSIEGKYKLYGSTGIIGTSNISSYNGKFILVARVGANAGLLNKVSGNFGVTDNTLVIDLKKLNIIDFIFYSLEKTKLNNLVFGSGQPLITGSQLKNLKLFLPNSEKEQQKIADCLSSLDGVISIHNDKLEALKNHKKGLLQNLFPQEGETVPKYRFPEFKNDREWEEKELNELGKLINGLTYSPNDVREKGLLVLRSSNVQNGLIDLKDCVYVRTDIKGANLSQPNDILVCVRNGSKALIGKNAMIPKKLPIATHGTFMTVFRAKNPYFAFQLFQTVFYEKQVSGDLGATINSINGKNFLKYVFPVPKNPKEQQKIADCLSEVDNLITAQADKIEQLKAHKKGLMQRLFPQLKA